MSERPNFQAKDIVGYEGLYQIYSTGHIWSNQSKIYLVHRLSSNGGRLQIALYKNGVRRYFYVHRLVALHFIPNPNNLPGIDHKDRNINNNDVSNLRWCSSSQNRMNVSTIKNNDSGFKNVSWESSNNKWRVRVQNEETLYRKRFNGDSDGLCEALIWRDEKLNELHGEFACYE